MAHGRLGRPAEDDDGGCFVSFGELDDDHVDCRDLARGQLGSLDMEILLPFASWLDLLARPEFVLLAGRLSYLILLSSFPRPEAVKLRG